MTTNVLFVGRQPDKYAPLWRHLLLNDVRVAFAASTQRANRELDEAAADVIVVDAASLRAPGDSIARSMRRSAPSSHVILIADNDVMAGLSYDYLLPENVHWHSLLKVVEQALQSERRQVLVVDPFMLDLAERTLIGPNGEARLTTKLFGLLELFMRNPGNCVSRKQIMQEVWHTDFMDDTRTLDVHMSWLRGIVEPEPRRPVYIRTSRGKGYTFHPNGDPDVASATSSDSQPTDEDPQ